MIIYNREVLCVVIQHFSKSSPFHHNVYASMVFVWMARNLMTPGCWHGHAKAFTDHCLCVFCLSSIFGVFLLMQLCLGCDQFFWFTYMHTTHNHLNYLHSTMGVNLLCLESITHHGFQFGPKKIEHLFPSMVQALPFFSTNSSKTFSHKLTTSMVQCTLSFCG